MSYCLTITISSTWFLLTTCDGLIAKYLSNETVFSRPSDKHFTFVNSPMCVGRDAPPPLLAELRGRVQEVVLRGRWYQRRRGRDHVLVYGSTRNTAQVRDGLDPQHCAGEGWFRLKRVWEAPLAYPGLLPAVYRVPHPNLRRAHSFFMFFALLSPKPYPCRCWGPFGGRSRTPSSWRSRPKTGAGAGSPSSARR